jgi:DNA-directed RNA polymerase subunit E"
MNEYACKSCKRLVSKKECPVCGGKEVTDKWKGLILVFDSNKSELAKKAQINFPGKYAIEVKE